MSKFLERYNKRFAVEPQVPEPAFRELPPDIDLDNILCVKISKRNDNGGVFSLHSRYYQVVYDDGKTAASIAPRAKITVLTSSEIGIRVQYSNNIYALRKLDESPKKLRGLIKQVHRAQPSLISLLLLILGNKVSRRPHHIGMRNQTERF